MNKLMKVAIASALFLPSLVFANTVQSVFDKNSILPDYMKEQVLNTVLAQCPTGVSKNGLLELATSVTPVQTSESYRAGLFYETHFYSQFYLDSRLRSQEIVVKSFFGRTENQEGEFSIQIIKAICP